MPFCENLTVKVAKIELGNGITIAVQDFQLPMTIGRSKECDIRISEPHISRLHCELYLDSKRKLCVKDLSVNGTSVDSQILSGESARVGSRSLVKFAGEAGLTVTLTDDDGITLFPAVGLVR